MSPPLSRRAQIGVVVQFCLLVVTALSLSASASIVYDQIHDSGTPYLGTVKVYTNITGVYCVSSPYLSNIKGLVVSNDPYRGPLHISTKIPADTRCPSDAVATVYIRNYAQQRTIGSFTVMLFDDGPVPNMPNWSTVQTSLSNSTKEVAGDFAWYRNRTGYYCWQSHPYGGPPVLTTLSSSSPSAPTGFAVANTQLVDDCPGHAIYTFDDFTVPADRNFSMISLAYPSRAVHNSGAFVSWYWAQFSDNGTVLAGAASQFSVEHLDTGIYCISAKAGIRQYAAVHTSLTDVSPVGQGFISGNSGPDLSECAGRGQIAVYTYDSAGRLADRPFTLLVHTQTRISWWAILLFVLAGVFVLALLFILLLCLRPSIRQKLTSMCSNKSTYETIQ